MLSNKFSFGFLKCLRNLFPFWLMMNKLRRKHNGYLLKPGYTKGASFAAQEMKFSIKDFFSKCDQNRSFQRIWSHFLKKSVMENFIFLCSLCDSSNIKKSALCGSINIFGIWAYSGYLGISVNLGYKIFLRITRKRGTEILHVFLPLRRHCVQIL